jgi:non-ribosomal peptide synthase protein (TIGR01720 family)
VGPANNKEELLLDAVHQILGTQEIGMTSNFYHYGGDSIKAIQIASKLNDLGLKIKVRDVLSNPVISEMAACLDYETNQIDQSPCEGSFKPTPIYQWFFTKNFTDENFYNQSIVLDFKDEISSESLQIIIDALIRHHDSLRLNYNRNAGELFYKNDLLQTISSVQTYNLSLYSPEEQDRRLEQLMVDFKAGFNIEAGILFKACIFDLGKRGKRVLFTAHHLVVDGVSWRIILEDIHRIYECIKTGEDITLPLKTHSLKDWSFHLEDYRKTKAVNEAAYWDRIAKQEFYFPVDFESGDDMLANCNTLTFHLNPAETGRLIKSSENSFGVKTDELLITALVRTISDFTGEKEVALELEGHGREDIFNDVDVTRTVGWFTCLYPVALKIAGTEIPEQLKAIKEQLRNIPNHGIGFGLLQADLEKESAKKQKPIRFNFLGDFNITSEYKYFTCSYQGAANDSNQSNQLTALLDINAMIVADELRISLTYSENKFKAATINDFLNKFKAQIEKVIECNNEPVDMATPSDFEMVKLSQDDLDSILI